jgi:hypothetical protein
MDVSLLFLGLSDAKVPDKFNTWRSTDFPAKYTTK